MKTIKYLFMTLTAIVFISCQNEGAVLIQDTTQNLTTVSPLTNLIFRVAQNPTSKDNVLDNSSCFNIQLPVKVIVDGNQITVSNQNDYKTVQATLDAFPNDDDIINFIYPITIQYQDYKTQLILNSDELEKSIENCNLDDHFNEIDCININYPISFSIYDANNQIAKTIVIQNDKDITNFLDNLGVNLYISINYPISITNFNGQNVVLTNNADFQNHIEDSIKECNTNSGTGSNPNFNSIWTDGTWHVSYFFKTSDETLGYSGYNFTFHPDGTVVAVNGTNSFGGTWSTFKDNGQDKLKFSFNEDKLDGLEEDWNITEYTATNVRLKNKNSNSTETYHLYFTKN